MGVLKTYMFQGLIKIDSQVCKDQDEVKKFVHDCLEKVINPPYEDVQIRKCEKVNA